MVKREDEPLRWLLLPWIMKMEFTTYSSDFVITLLQLQRANNANCGRQMDGMKWPSDEMASGWGICIGCTPPLPRNDWTMWFIATAAAHATHQSQTLLIVVQIKSFSYFESIRYFISIMIDAVVKWKTLSIEIQFAICIFMFFIRFCIWNRELNE